MIGIPMYETEQETGVSWQKIMSGLLACKDLELDEVLGAKDVEHIYLVMEGARDTRSQQT